MKKALIISCNDNYDYNTRTKYVCDFLEKSGHKVKFLVADFDHRNKRVYKAEHNGDICYIHVLPYKKNLSVARILSHIQFANGVKKFVAKNHFNLVYHCAPPNWTIKELSKCKNNKDFRLITEIGDMWPETMPVGGMLKKVLGLPFKFWSNLRDKHLYNSDVIIAECDLFNELLRKKSHANKIETMYFCKPYLGGMDNTWYHLSQKIVLGYLGSINNIIDIDIIKDLIHNIALHRPVVLHIVGDGEKRQEMISAVKDSCEEVIFHGMVFDDDEKQYIFAQCHFALNVMKSEVCVGMTMKSLDYFSFGIPLINNIGGDIEKIVEGENVGFNINSDNICDIANKMIIMSDDDYLNMRKHVHDSHVKHFSVSSFNNKFSTLI